MINQINNQSVANTTGNILGGWAIYGDNFASYNPVVGLTWAGQTGGNAFYQTGGGGLLVAGVNDNVNATTAIGVTSRTVNALRWRLPAASFTWPRRRTR